MTATPIQSRMVAVAMGLVSGFLAGYLAFPIPDYKIAAGDFEFYVNQADMAPISAPLFYSIGMVLVLWRAQSTRRLGLVLGVPSGIFAGWLLAVNLAVQIVDRTGQTGGAAGELVVWLVAGALAGAVGAAFTWLGARAAGLAPSHAATLRLVAAVGAVFGLLLYPSYQVFEQGWLLFAPWQAAVACIIASMRRSI